VVVEAVYLAELVGGDGVERMEEGRVVREELDEGVEVAPDGVGTREALGLGEDLEGAREVLVLRGASEHADEVVGERRAPGRDRRAVEAAERLGQREGHPQVS
jgi:hypothetical protein